MNLKRFRKPLIIVAVLGILGFAGVKFIGGQLAAAAAAMIQPPRTVLLEKGDLSNVVSVNGTVFSAETTHVYSTVNAPVLTVHVEVGDVVEEGDLLAELDPSDLEQTLAKTRANLSSQQATAQHNLEVAQKDLETFQNSTDKEYNASVVSAESSLRAAEVRVDNAVSAAYRARKKMNEARDDAGKDSDDYEAAKEAHDIAQDAVKEANVALESAQKAYDAAVAGNTDSAESMQDKVRGAEIAADFTSLQLDIQGYQKDIADCRVTAPVSGTVTAVHAVEGASGSGLLFVLQDAGNLRIIANIKEYDLADVSLGDPVNVRSDATGGRTYEGTLTRIAPTSLVAAGGEVAIGDDAEYESEVTLKGDLEGLRIGMNTKLGIVTQEKRDVYSVPYEAVWQEADGSYLIFVLEMDGEGNSSTRAISVELGMENDLFSEVLSAELEDGLQIYREAEEGYAAWTLTQMMAAEGAGDAEEPAEPGV